MNEDIFEQNKRWYDADPTVALAINLIEKTEQDVKNHCVKFIVEEAQSRGAQTDASVNDFDYAWRRYWDKEEKLFEAIEYFKKLDEDAKKRIALEIVEYIKSFKK